MAYRIFLSHSTKDLPIAERIASDAEAVGVEVYIAEKDKQPGTRIRQKIEANLRASNALVVLLTLNGHGSTYVQHEIGWAEREGKLIIPIKDSRIETESIGMLQDREYILMDPENPTAAYLELRDFLKRLKLKTEEDLRALLVVGVIILFTAVLATK